MRKSLSLLSLAVMLLVSAGCQGELATAEVTGFEGSRARELVAQQVAFGPRPPGSAGNRQLQQWIADQLQDTGWAVTRQPFTYQEIELVNLIGSNTAQEGPYYLLGAHYDTRPVADQERVPDPGPVIGANDGGSGVAVLLELARALPPHRLNCRLELAFFDGEDSGNLNGWDWIVGSSYMAANLAEKPDGVVIVDMVGDEQLSLPRERNSDEQLQDQIWEVGQSLGYRAFEDRQGYSMLDDHTPFLQAEIPALDIIDFDYPYWHTEQDTLDKISAASLEAVGRTLQGWLSHRCLSADQID
jgi:hypothetical protein